MNESPISNEESQSTALETEKLLEGNNVPTNTTELQMFLIEEHYLMEHHDVTRDQFAKDNGLQIEAMHFWNDAGLSAVFRGMIADRRYKGVTSIKLEDGKLVWREEEK